MLGNDLPCERVTKPKAETYRVMLIERWVTTAILAFIILIISFNIIGCCSMLVLENPRHLHTQSYGRKQSLVLRVYLLNGILASLIGTGVGLLFAMDFACCK